MVDTFEVDIRAAMGAELYCSECGSPLSFIVEEARDNCIALIVDKCPDCAEDEEDEDES